MRPSFDFIAIVSISVFLICVAEIIYLRIKRPGFFDANEAWLSVSDMLGRRLLELLPLNLAAPVYDYLWANRINTIEMNGVMQRVLLILGTEFCYYWYHRASHRIRFFWASHAVHHSPNQITLSTAFRFGWTGRLTGTLLFYTPLAYLGFDPQIIFMTLAYTLLYQFWLHTTLIPKLGWFGYIFNTPSHHRAHHASNLTYLDANYGSSLIIFDRMFGTFVEEKDSEPCVYGWVKPIRTKNMFTLQFTQWKYLFQDLARAKSIREFLGLIVMPPGWSAHGAGQTTKELKAQAQPVVAAATVANLESR